MRRLRARVLADRAALLERQLFLCKLAHALVSFGSPAHRIEGQLEHIAKALDVAASFIHWPGIVCISFGDPGSHTSVTRFVKAPGGLRLGQMHELHKVRWQRDVRSNARRSTAT